MEQTARKTLAPLIVLACLLISEASAQLRVVSWNTAGGPRDGIGEILEAIGNESVNGIAKPIDVLSLQEQSSSATTTQAIVDILNSIYGPGAYDRATLDGQTSGGGRPGLVYNTNTISFVTQDAIGSVNTSAQARQTMHYVLQANGYSSDGRFNLFSSHYKAGTGSSNENRRLIEAQAIRGVTDSLIPLSNIIYTGDFNIQDSDEAMYAELMAPGPGQAFDPINSPGDWHDDIAFKSIHTQATSVNPPSGLSGGGVDDRFDFQLVDDDLIDGHGLDYIPGSYRAFGNNGTHTLNGNISSGTGASASILSALETVSDHLPVVADYQVPATMHTVLGDIPTTILLGTQVEIELTVENSANVVAPLGADSLDYEVIGEDGILGSVVGSDLALGGGNTHSFTLDTSSIGSRHARLLAGPTAPGQFVLVIPIWFNVVANADFDLDGDVDGMDFLTWQRGVGMGSTFERGDANGDGAVDEADLAIWQSQHGGVAVGAVAVPEPSGLCLALGCVAVYLTAPRQTQARW